MIQYLFLDTSKLLNISDITKRIGNFFKLPIQLFMVFLIPNSRYKVLMQIENSIARMNRIIATNNMICRGMIHTGLKIWHVQDILSDKAMDSIANKIIALWIGNQSEG